MEPVTSNNIYLSSDKDIFGSFIPAIKYSLSDTDKRTIYAMNDKVYNYFSSQRGFHISLSLPPIDLFTCDYDSSHHLGGTVMGISPDSSVVDSKLKVHSLDNLHIVSGSVFPTSGSHNPTFTIAALSIYLSNIL